MSKIIRDIGYIYPKNNQPFSLPNAEGQLVKRTQTFQATHDGEGIALPYRFRSFISFAFGGKDIEDFGIIRVTGGDRLNQPIYTSFQDLISQYNVLDGQFYWGTHYKPLEINYTLSTDYMTQRQLDQFKAWFAPGKIRQLVRAEHPNRAILARVREAPTLNMLPFEGEEEAVFAQTRIKVPTTIYKGDITIGFVADDPFWYSLCNMLGTRYAIVNNSDQPIPASQYTMDQHFLYYEFRWYDASGKLVETFTDKDALKIILQDNIPTANMIRIFSNFFLGDNNIICNYQQAVNQAYTNSAIVAPENYNDESTEHMYAHVGYARVGKYYAPTVQLLDLESSGIDLSNEQGSVAYLYYAGNAISYPILRFELNPILSRSSPHYIINPGNQYGVKIDNETNLLFNTITIQSQNKHVFKFTTPSAWNGYNQAISIFKQLSQKQDGNGTALTQVKIKIRQGVNHKDARAWAIQIVQCFESIGIKSLVNKNNTSNTQIHVDNFYKCMRRFITDSTIESTIIQTKTSGFSGKFQFNSKTGGSIGEIQYRNLPVNVNNDYFHISSSNDLQVNIDNIIQAFSNFQKTQHKQKVGDMVKSSYLFLEETNHLTQDGLIVPWSEDNKLTTHKIYTDYPTVINSNDEIEPCLTNFSIQYKNMYL